MNRQAEIRGHNRDRITRLFADAEYFRDQYLRERGWDCTSSYPDCVWRWHLDVDGQRLTCTQADEALRVQDALDA